MINVNTVKENEDYPGFWQGFDADLYEDEAFIEVHDIIPCYDNKPTKQLVATAVLTREELITLRDALNSIDFSEASE